MFKTYYGNIIVQDIKLQDIKLQDIKLLHMYAYRSTQLFLNYNVKVLK